MSDDRERSRRPMWARHPWILVILVGSTLAGGVLGLLLQPESWSTPRAVLAGLIGGAGIGYIVTATRLVGVDAD